MFRVQSNMSAANPEPNRRSVPNPQSYSPAAGGAPDRMYVGGPDDKATAEHRHVAPPTRCACAPWATGAVAAISTAPFGGRMSVFKRVGGVGLWTISARDEEQLEHHEDSFLKGHLCSRH